MTNDMLHQLFSEIGVPPDEWPALAVMRETLPPRLRVLVAAAMANEAEPESKLADALLVAFQMTGASESVVEETATARSNTPDEPWEESRRFVRAWLSGDWLERLLVPTAADGRRARAPVSSAWWKRITDIVHLRYAAINELIASARDESSLDNSVAWILVYYRAAFDSRTAVEAVPIPPASPLVKVAWFKHLAEVARSLRRLDLAALFVNQAEAQASSARSSRVLDDLVFGLRQAVLGDELQRASPASILARVEATRERHRGFARVRVAAKNASTTRWLASMLSEDLAFAGDPWPITAVLEWSVDQIAAAIDAAIALAHIGSIPEARNTLESAEAEARGAGAWSVEGSLAKAHAVIELHDSPPRTIAALEWLALSYPSDGAKIFKTLSNDDLRRSGDHIDSQGVERLIAICRANPVLQPVREALLMQIFEHLSAGHALGSSAAGAVWRWAMEVAGNSNNGSWSNTDGVTPALRLLQNIFRLMPEFTDWQGNDVVQLVKQKLGPAGPWTVVEGALNLAAQAGSRLDESCRVAVVELIASFVLARLEAEGEDSFVENAAFRVLVEQSLLVTAKQQPSLRATLVLICELLVLRASASGAGWSNRWAMAFALANEFDVLVLPVSASKVAERMIEQAQEKNSSAATSAVRTLFTIFRTLSENQRRSTLRALIALIRYRSPRKHGRPGVLETALAVRQATQLPNEMREAFNDELTELYMAVRQFLTDALREPLLLAPFSIPEAVEPSASIVWQWSFAFLVLGGATRRKDAESVIGSLAEALPRNAEAARRALADWRVSSLASGEVPFDDVGLRRMSRDEFLECAPSMIPHVAVIADDGLVAALLELSLRFGPSSFDAAIFSLALSRGLQPPEGAVDVYFRRLGHSRPDVDRHQERVLVRLCEALNRD